MKNVETKELHDLIISGSGSAGGGSFHNVKISGSGKISGDVDCKEVKISGSGTIFGNILSKTIKTSGSSIIIGDVKAKSIGISGNSKVEGNVFVENMSISGSSKFSSDITCKEFEVNGSTKINGKLLGGEIEANGMITVENDCEVERFKSKGVVTINGLLSADDIDIKVDYKSFIKEIGGEKISVKHFPSINVFKQILNFILQKEIYLHTDIIEGDEIYLENTKAKLVRGKYVIIGEKCDIGKVEYFDTLDITENTTVKESVKI